MLEINLKKKKAQLPCRSYYNEFINCNSELFFKDNEKHMIKIKRGWERHVNKTDSDLV
jgi:hypothetical protein